MKNAVSFLLSFLFVVSLSACGTHTQSSQTDSETNHVQEATSAVGTDSAAESDTVKSPQEEPTSMPAETTMDPASSRGPSTDISTPAQPAQPAQSAPPEQPESAKQPEISPQEPVQEEPMDDAVTKLKIDVGGQTFTATLEQNDATTALIAMLPITLSMSDYSGFEKVGSLGAGLPTNNAQTTTQAGDIVLYNGNQIVIFYGSNSWSYTRLAHVDDLTGWAEALGSGDVTVTFSVQ